MDLNNNTDSRVTSVDEIIAGQELEAQQQAEAKLKLQQEEEVKNGERIDNPLGQFMEDTAVEVRDWIDNKLQNNQRSKEQIRADRAQARLEGQAFSNQVSEDINNAEGIGAVYRESVRAVAGGIAGAGESLANTVDWTGDLIKQQFVDEDPTQDVFSNEYEAASYDLGIAENTTAVGAFAREAVTMLTLMRGARALPVVGGIGTGAEAGLGARLGGEAARGAIADLINDAGDGNFSNMLEDVNPALKDTWITALAQEDDDNIFIRKIKNAVEGGIFGLTVDGIGELYGAIRAGRKVANAIKDSELHANSLSLEDRVLFHGTSKAGGEAITSSGFKASPAEVMPGRGVYFAEDDFYAAAYAYDDGLDYATSKGTVLGNGELPTEGAGPVLSGRLPAGTKILDIPKTGLNLRDFVKRKGIKTNLVKWAKSQGFDGIRYEPDFGAKPGDGGAIEVFVFDPAKADQIIAQKSSLKEAAVDAALDANPPKEFGYEGRAAENAANSATPNREALWEPNERAGKTVVTGINELIDSQDRLIAAGNPVNGGASSVINGDLIREIVSSKGATEGLTRLIRAAQAGADLDALRTGLKGRVSDDSMKTFPIIDQFIQQGNKALEELVPQKTGGSIPAYMTPEGGKVTRALIFDTAEQLNDLAEAAIDVANISGDTFKQSDMMIDNLRVLLRFDKFQGAEYGSSLLSRKDLPLSQKTLNEAKLTKQLEEMDKSLLEMKGKLQSGDPEAIAEFKTFTDSLLLADGDPEKMLTFWQAFRKVGSRNLQSSMYNGHLSSPKSQIRNIMGGVTQATLRPLTQAIGFGIKGQLGEAKASIGAFYSLNESIGEALSIARKSWKSNGANSDIIRIDNRTDETRKILEVMKAQAKTPAEKFLATQKQLEFDFFNNDWVSWPSRGLTAMDDAMRTLSSRMIMKTEVFEESLNSGAGFRFNAERYAELVDQKIGINGEILDEKLLSATKNITFQEDLTGFAKYLQDGADKYPVMKLFLPFIKTPTNMLAATMDYVPGWNRVADRMPLLNNFTKKYRQVMKGTDESAKAIYRGREAIGIATITTSASLALTGNLTGNGPQDPEKRKIWEQTHQRNSIKIGGIWISYESIEPLNTIFAATADLAQIAFAGNGEAYDRSFAQLSYTLAAAITQKSYFQGLIQATKVMDIAGGQFEGAVQDTAAMVANLVLPLSNARRGLSQALAPGVQEWRNEWEKDLANAVPGYANLFGSNRIDIFSGKPLEDQNDNIFNLFLPFNVKAVDDDPVLNFLSDSGVSVSMEIADTIKGLELSDEQKTSFQQYMADYGLYDNLKSLIKEKWFVRDHEAWKDANSELVEDERWYREIKREFTNARRAAAQALSAEDPFFATSYKEALRAKQDRRYGNYQGNKQSTTSAEDLINLSQQQQQL